MTPRIREILHTHARLSVDVATLDDDSDLYAAGLSSHASVTLMLALEDAFQVQFPEHLLRRKTFESIANIRDAVTEMVRQRTNAPHVA